MKADVLKHVAAVPNVASALDAGKTLSDVSVEHTAASITGAATQDQAAVSPSRPDRATKAGSAKPKSKAFDRIKKRAETDKQTNFEVLEAAQAAGTAKEMSVSAVITSSA